jgi:hypothetical protein
MTSLIAYFGYEIKQINGPITWVQTRIRKRPQPAPMLGYGLIKQPKFGLAGIGSAFWGVVAGAAALFVQQWRPRAAARESSS